MSLLVEPHRCEMIGVRRPDGVTALVDARGRRRRATTRAARRTICRQAAALALRRSRHVETVRPRSLAVATRATLWRVRGCLVHLVDQLEHLLSVRRAGLVGEIRARGCQSAATIRRRWLSPILPRSCVPH